MAADVQQFVTSCDTCQRMKSSKQKKTGLLQPIPVPEQPWQVVSLDFITGLPSTSRGNDSILVVIDKFSKMGHFIPTNATATAEATARLLFDRIITIHGIPATLISDRDPKFTSKFWKELMGLLGTKLAMSSAYHPQTDGQIERLNQVVEQLLRTACKDDVSHWDTQLPTLEFAYNNASHAATGKTPFFLCYGREPLTPQQPTTPAHVQAAHDFVTTMQQLWEKTQRRLTTMQTSQKQYADHPHSLPLQPPLLCRPSRVLPCLALRAALLAARRPALPAMASLSVLTFDHKGRPIQFNTWLDDLQLYLLSDSRDSVSLFDHTSGASLAHPATADSATRSQWLTRDAAARLAFRNHLPLAERARFGQQKTAKALYDALVARY
ncbi:unnamed protein product [Closterium sp. NIES-54]